MTTFQGQGQRPRSRVKVMTHIPLSVPWPCAAPPHAPSPTVSVSQAVSPPLSASSTPAPVYNSSKRNSSRWLQATYNALKFRQRVCGSLHLLRLAKCLKSSRQC